ncbi:hypothetical protein SAMN04487785_108180 [Dyella jiangningensis]|uniref:hypothetical protein n=2 Tax=Gammaproteobacteria TaxID=1236 RepID=UPI0008921DF4|nr:hypothetical protein [Dyella sp. AtDHG13]PXV55821.1 hypothetical protein BDW41_11018 [Dyella sp. AtDHG13]SDK55362.1 hypothetical protein SAMN04487785_108180 [Dyella jiangningensis]
MHDTATTSLMGQPAPLGGHPAIVLATDHAPTVAAMADDRLECQKVISIIYARYFEHCAHYGDALTVWLEPSRLRSFRRPDGPPIIDLRRLLSRCSPGSSILQAAEGGTLNQLQALADCASRSTLGVIDWLRLLLSVEQIDESSWGLLLALAKDAELATLSHGIELLCEAQRQQRRMVEQRYEDLTLILSRTSEAAVMREDGGHR